MRRKTPCKPRRKSKAEIQHVIDHLHGIERKLNWLIAQHSTTNSPDLAPLAAEIDQAANEGRALDAAVAADAKPTTTP